MRKLCFSSILCLVILAIASYCLAADPGDIVINEAIQDPAAVTDANGEWFELYNATDSDIDIDGWTIRDDGTDSHTINNGGPLWVPTDSFLVLGRNSNSTTNGGYHCDYQYSGFTLGNSDDEIYLIEGSTVIDSILYDGGTNWPDPTGKSMELTDPTLDNNVGANWHEAYTTYGDGDYGTPGRTNSVAPVNIPPDISGVFHTPRAPTSSDPMIVRATITDSDGSIADDSLYYQVTSKAFTAIYHDSIGVGTDNYYYTVPAQSNWSLVEYYLMAKDDYGDRTVSDTTSYTVQVPGDVANPGDVVCNEIMQNPAAVLDNNGEYVELFNTTGSPIDINMWVLRDNDSDSLKIANGSPLYIPAGGFLVLAADSSSSTNGGFDADYQYGAFYLANASDEVVLLDVAGTTIDSVAYDNGATFPDPDGASMELKNPGYDNTVGSNWAEAESTFGLGDKGTPGDTNSVYETGDFIPPTVNIAFATGQTGMDVHFSEVVDQTTSENTANYTLTSGLSVSTASRDVSTPSIVHLTTGNQTNGWPDTLIVSSVADTSNNTMPAPDSAGFRQGFTPISMIQTPGTKAGDESQLLDEIVTITCVVTADTSTYSSAYLYIQDGGTAWSGIKAYFGSGEWGALEGDSVTIAGQVLEYLGETEVEAAGVYHVVNSTGNSLPAPIEVQTGEVATGSPTAESYEGVLIQVNKAWVTNADLGFGEWEIYDGSSDSCRVDDAVDYSYTPVLDDTVGVIGVLVYTYDNFKIEPRYDADIDTTIVGVRVSDLSAIPGSFSLSQNYPNPFNPVTQISFSLPEGSEVRLSVYNIAGQQVAELVNEKLDAGSYRVSWDAKSFASGIYFYRIEVGDYHMTKKMVFLK